MHLITFHGANLQSGALLWFQFSDQSPIVSSFVLNPRKPDHPGSVIGNDWAEWGSYMYIPTASCYYLEASWPGGH
jgi:hypothetical protein